MKDTHTKFKFPLYPCNLYLAMVGKNSESIGETNFDGKDFYVSIDENEANDPSLIAHEAFHVLHGASSYLGLTIEGEHSAYLLEWIVSVMTAFTKVKKE